MSRSNKGAESRLHRKRYRDCANRSQLVGAVAEELARVVRLGRVPWDVALDALDMVRDEIEDDIANESPSWALSVRWNDTNRAQMKE